MKKIVFILVMCSAHAFGQSEKSGTSKVVNIEVGHRHWWPARSYIKIRTSTQAESECGMLRSDQSGVKPPLAEKRTETIVSVRPGHFWRRGGMSFYSLVFNR